MKTKYVNLLLFTLFFTASLSKAQNTGTISVSGARFTYPLLEKWISEYAKINPAITINLIDNTSTSVIPDLNIIAHKPASNELKEDQEILYAGRYGLLPVTNSINPILSTTKRGLNKKDIDKLFFEVENTDDDPVTEKPKYRATIYSRDNKSSVSIASASYFGHVSSEIKGKKVLGDDIYLLSAVRKDTIGITFNNLGYLYDTGSRKLKEGIALLPLELKKENRNIATGNLDEVISILETNRIETIPVEKIGFIYSLQNTGKEVSDFLLWILTDGQQFNHGKGFLNLGKQELAEQTNRLTQKLLSQK